MPGEGPEGESREPIIDLDRIANYEAAAAGEHVGHYWGRQPGEADRELFLPHDIPVLKDVSGGDIYYVGEVTPEQAAIYAAKLRAMLEGAE